MKGEQNMLVKSITYTDYNGNERTEEFHFNLSNAEVAEMELSITGGLTNMINRVIAAQDNPTIMKIFKELIVKSYGVKSPDGKKFIKNEETINDFLQTEAYSILFMELCTDAQKAAAFFKAVLPTPKNENQVPIPMNR